MTNRPTRPKLRGSPGLALLPVLLLAACAQPVRYGRPGFDFPIPYDGTDPAAEARFGSGRARGGSGGASRVSNTAPTRFYPPPGTASDPWGPYIHEAGQRFRVPEQWVRAVMHQESGGQEQAVSSAGAMGLMQVMPATYAGLRGRYSLGADPYDPHNNIMAGVAYIREMYDRFGSPGFLAAYNAGPDRLDSYVNGGVSLPDETVNYVASISPHLGTEVAMSGPLAQYASAAPIQSAVPYAAPTPASFAAGCDPNAAYDPDRPCAPLLAVSFTPDPPATPASVPTPRRPPMPTPVPTPADGSRGWSIQVGAFNSPVLARVVAEGARSEAPAQLGGAALEFPVVISSGAKLYRARLTNLSAAGANDACAVLARRQLPCVVVTPRQMQTS